MAAVGLLLLAVFCTLYFARPLILPVVLALNLALLLAPAVGGLRRMGLPEPAGAALVVLALLAGLAWGVYMLSGPAMEWAAKLPESVRAIERKVRNVRQPVETVRKAAQEVDKLTTGEPPGGRTPVVAVKEPGVVSTVLSGTTTLAAEAVLMVLTLYFLLASGDLFLRKVIRVLPTLADKKRAVEIARETKEHISAYLFTIAAINAGLGIVLGLIFALLGLPSPVLWAVMVFLLNFIPFLGPLTGVAVLGIVAAVTFPGVGKALMVPAIYFVLHNLETNVITPLILGRRLTLNPLVIFLWLSLWFWLWGVPGALLAVPMLKTLKIFCDNIPRLEPVGEFLGR
jgi:predicted PurR-regulated permease PerM